MSKESDANPAFTRRHYREVAEILGSNCIESDSQLAKDFCSFFQADNPRFDKSKFITAIKRNTPEKCRVSK